MLVERNLIDLFDTLDVNPSYTVVKKFFDKYILLPNGTCPLIEHSLSIRFCKTTFGRDRMIGLSLYRKHINFIYSVDINDVCMLRSYTCHLYNPIVELDTMLKDVSYELDREKRKHADAKVECIKEKRVMLTQRLSLRNLRDLYPNIVMSKNQRKHYVMQGCWPRKLRLLNIKKDCFRYITYLIILKSDAGRERYMLGMTQDVNSFNT